MSALAPRLRQRTRSASPEPDVPSLRQQVAAPSIIDAMNDPQLFAPFFVGPSWRPWKAFLCSLFALPMNSTGRAAFKHFTNRNDVPTQPFREAVAVVGRRGGKSRVMASIAVYLAVFRSYKPAPGEQIVIGVIASDRKQAAIVLRYCLGLLRHCPLTVDLIEGETADEIRLSNSVTVEIATASMTSVRGRTAACYILDEVAFFRTDDGSRSNDGEIVNACKPALATLRGLLLAVSSPYAKRGHLYAQYRKHFGRDGSPVLVWKGSSLEMNPELDPQIVADAYEEDPVSAASEYDAEFRDDISGFVTREIIDRCVMPGRLELPPVGSATYHAFCDPSGGRSDSFTLAIGHHHKGAAVVDVLLEIRAPFSPDEAVQLCAEYLKRYRCLTVTGDRYAGEWPRERFAAYGIRYVVCEQARSDLYKTCLPILNDRRCELPDVARMSNQFVALERHVARGGRDSIDHAPGAHDDLANSVAGLLCMIAPERALDLWAKLGEQGAAGYSAFLSQATGGSAMTVKTDMIGLAVRQRIDPQRVISRRGY